MNVRKLVLRILVLSVMVLIIFPSAVLAEPEIHINSSMYTSVYISHCDPPKLFTEIWLIPVDGETYVDDGENCWWLGYDPTGESEWTGEIIRQDPWGNDLLTNGIMFTATSGMGKPSPLNPYFGFHTSDESGGQLSNDIKMKVYYFDDKGDYYGVDEITPIEYSGWYPLTERDGQWMVTVYNLIVGPPNRKQILSQDNFNNSGSGWSISMNNEREKTYKNGKYSITVKKPNWQFRSWVPRESFPADFEVKVDARQVMGPTGKYGIIWGKDGDNYYVFTISSDGRCRLRKQVKDVWQTNPVSWTNSPAIKRGTGRNQLKVIVIGNSITLIVNDTILTTVKGCSFGPGKIGLVGGTFAKTNVEVQFDNFKIEQLALLFKDNFNNSGSGWSISMNNEREKTYKNGKYSITVKKPNWQFRSWVPRESFPADFEVKVDARQVMGPTGKYGIIWGKDGDNYYVFTISSDGRCRLRKQVKDVWQTNPVSWTNSPAIKRGTGRNQLKVIVIGNSITLIVNDTILTTVKGCSFGPGKIGLVGGTFAKTNVEVQFDNLMIYDFSSL